MAYRLNSNASGLIETLPGATGITHLVTERIQLRG